MTLQLGRGNPFEGFYLENNSLIHFDKFKDKAYLD
jgi:hypothetical protein